MTLKEVLESVEKESYKVTPNQIWRYQEAGLLPKPKVISLGGRKGKESIFKDGTDNQLLQICRLKKKSKDNNYVLWNLWLNGFDVDIDKMKELITSSINLVVRVKERLLSNPAYVGLDSLDISEEILKSENLLNQLNKKDQELFNIKSEIDIGKFTMIIRLLLLNDNSSLEDLKWDIESVNYQETLSNEQIYVDLFQQPLKLVDQLKSNYEVIEEFNSLKLIEYLKYAYKLTNVDVLKETTNSLNKEKLKVSFNIINSLKNIYESSNLRKNINFNFYNPITSFFISFFLIDEDLTEIFEKDFKKMQEALCQYRLI